LVLWRQQTPSQICKERSLRFLKQLKWKPLNDIVIIRLMRITICRYSKYICINRKSLIVIN
jgi:hypothetical protein